MARLTLALIAHDEKKPALVAFAKHHRRRLAALHLVATGTTGSRVAEETGLAVECMLSGPQGGDAQIAARVCNVHDVPLATNLASAEILIQAVAGLRSPPLRPRR